jgi:uncharacterized protein (DUF58 family)
MNRDKIRLRPTGLWILFGPVLGCMWLAAVNYSNNLIYGILYLIGSLSFISIFHTWRNLALLEVEHIRVNPAFAGEDVRVEIHLRNTARFQLYGMYFLRLGEEAGLSRRPTQLRLRGGGGLRIAAGDSAAVEAVFPSGRRGIYRFETMQIRSSFPFGLFWASFRVPVQTEYYVYPQARGNRAWPEKQPSGDDGSPMSNRPGDDFAGVRAHMPGESLRHVDWKAYARGRPLSVKQFSGGSGWELWFDAADLLRLPLEERLSQLTIWIINAEKEETPYVLRVGRVTLPLGLGPAQAKRALEALAVAGIGPTEKPL